MEGLSDCTTTAWFYNILESSNLRLVHTAPRKSGPLTRETEATETDMKCYEAIAAIQK